MKTDSTAAAIAELNDRFRREGFGAGQIFISAAIRAMPDEAQQAIYQSVSSFDAFTEDNDPWSEHDFGSFAYQGCKVLWKIDYYDPALEHGSENPADPAKTFRVLTIMLGEEW